MGEALPGVERNVHLRNRRRNVDCGGIVDSRRTDVVLNLAELSRRAILTAQLPLIVRISSPERLSVKSSACIGKIKEARLSLIDC